MPWALSPISMQDFVDNAGYPVRPARLYFYKPNTLDPVTVYQDSGLSVPYPQPVVTGGNGRVPPIYVGADDYRIRVTDSAGVLVEDIPQLPGAQDAGGGGTPTPDTAIETGDIIAKFSNGATRVGWVRANGNTIGSALSSATERANADAHNLFVYLWGQDDGTQLPVTPSRGASAEGDWLANKQLQLPDMRNSTLVGLGTMGKTERGLLTNAALTWSVSGSASKMGSSIGAGFQVMTTAQMPSHNHALTDPGHNHTLTDPGHNHTISQSAHGHGVNDGGHSHLILDPSHIHTYIRSSASSGVAGASGTARDSADTATTASTTGITLQVNTTGISIQAQFANVANVASFSGVTIAGVTTGITLASAGTGAAQNNMQPSVVATFYIRL